MIRGRSRLIELDRTYNALDAAVATKPGPFGYGWTHSYAPNLTTDPTSHAVTVHQEGGATISFSQPKTGTYVGPPYATATLTSGAGGTLIFTLKNGKVDTFNAAGQLISETDRNGYQTTISHAVSGALLSVTDPAGRVLAFTTGATGLISQVIDPAGRKVTYTYDASNNLIEVKDVNGGATAYTYDSHHRLLTVKNANGGVTTNVYDSVNRIVKQSDPAGRATTWSYTAVISASNGTNTTTVTNAASHVSVRKFVNCLLSSLVCERWPSGSVTGDNIQVRPRRPAHLDERRDRSDLLSI